MTSGLISHSSFFPVTAQTRSYMYLQQHNNTTTRQHDNTTTQQRDFYYDTLRAIENGINVQIGETPSLGQTQTAIDLVRILQQTEV
jgi:REP element-mobilizing transposase RayT